jgi:hypothetical protein
MWQRAVLGGVLLLVSAATAEAQFSPPAFVDQLYERYFGRQPYLQELDYWLDRMERGDPPIVVEAGIIGSPAYFQQNKYNVTLWVRDVFRKVLGRNPNADELAWWSHRAAQLGGDREQWALDFLGEVSNASGGGYDDDVYDADGYPFDDFGHDWYQRFQRW